LGVGRDRKDQGGVGRKMVEVRTEGSQNRLAVPSCPASSLCLTLSVLPPPSSAGHLIFLIAFCFLSTVLLFSSSPVSQASRRSAKWRVPSHDSRHVAPVSARKRLDRRQSAASDAFSACASVTINELGRNAGRWAAERRCDVTKTANTLRMGRRERTAKERVFL
jgi:hypothetical protein